MLKFSRSEKLMEFIHIDVSILLRIPGVSILIHKIIMNTCLWFSSIIVDSVPLAHAWFIVTYSAIFNYFKLNFGNWCHGLIWVFFYRFTVDFEATSLMKRLRWWVYLPLTLKSFTLFCIILRYHLRPLRILLLLSYFCSSSCGHGLLLLCLELSCSFLFCFFGSLLFLLIMDLLQFSHFFLFWLFLLLLHDRSWWICDFLLHFCLLSYISGSLLIF